MIEKTRFDELSTAAALRQDALWATWMARQWRDLGRPEKAERSTAIAAGLREMAALVEWAPFEANRGPACLANVVRDGVRGRA